ncbi:CMRF35-like molecule 6 [Myotis brandtii]|uniref:CMRF35-like molecule 6 n=1 Tax=Myotis brandtii TaxID=109478 RepID=S7P465_MYOBR|nr:CMRF35-like molecule 6 [Myotis brandtii]
MKIVETTESEREVRSGRVSIRDDPATLTFTVTLERLTVGDEGKYMCGIDTPWTEGLIDLIFPVEVSVSPAPTLKIVTSTLGPPSTLGSTSTLGPPRTLGPPSTLGSISTLGPPRTLDPPSTLGPPSTLDPPSTLGPPSTLDPPSTLGPPSTLDPPSSLPATTGPSVTSQETPDASQHPWSLFSTVHFLLLVFLKVPLLLSMLGAVLWVNRPQRSSGGRQSQPCSEDQ